MPEESYSGLTADMAVELLTSYRLIHRDRDKIVRAAYTAGMTQQQIHICSGIARSTIDRALEAGGE